MLTSWLWRLYNIPPKSCHANCWLYQWYTHSWKDQSHRKATGFARSLEVCAAQRCWETFFAGLAMGSWGRIHFCFGGTPSKRWAVESVSALKQCWRVPRTGGLLVGRTETRKKIFVGSLGKSNWLGSFLKIDTPLSPPGYEVKVHNSKLPKSMDGSHFHQ